MVSPNLASTLTLIEPFKSFQARAFEFGWPPEGVFSGPEKSAAQAQLSLPVYLTTDTQALGILSWVSFLVTVIGLVVAVWQIAKVRASADAARMAATDLSRTVRSREMMLQMNAGISYLEHARNHAGKNSRDAAGLCLDLSITALIGAKELAEAEQDQQALQKVVVGVRLASESMEAMSEPITDDEAYQKTIKKVRNAESSIKQVSSRLRYSYSTQEM